MTNRSLPLTCPNPRKSTHLRRPFQRVSFFPKEAVVIRGLVLRMRSCASAHEELNSKS